MMVWVLPELFSTAGPARPEIRLAVVPKNVETHGNKMPLYLVASSFVSRVLVVY